MAWTVESMRPLVESFDERVRHDMGHYDRLREPGHARGSVLRNPASEEDIQRAEERLGTRLPPSYRAFLLISNGAYASALGAEIQYPFEQQWRHGLLRVGDIDLAVNADPIGVEVWCDEIPDFSDPANDVVPKPGEQTEVGYFAPYRHGLVITHIHNGTNRLALVPRPGQEEWDLWDMHWSGASAHPSFGDFLEWYAARPEPRWPKPEDADELVSKFTEEGVWSLYTLADLGDPRVIDLARQAVETGTHGHHVAVLLGQMAVPESLPLLRELYRRSAGAARLQALKSMEHLGAEDLDEFLRDALRDDDEAVRGWAGQRLDAR